MTKRTLCSCAFLPVGIAVCALIGHAQTSAGTRIEETDKSITYTGNWYTNASTPNSGGGAALTNAIGATAVVTFTGTGITWIGVLDPWAGMATVYLDGTKNTVDTYGTTTLYQQTLFRVSGLAKGPHTLSIEVTHMRDANGLGSWVWIDGFDVENGAGVAGGVAATTGRVEQNNAALTYTGAWFPNISVQHSGGNALLATDAGSRATINFNGTGITWIAYRDEWSGIARVYADGILKATIDTYLTPSQAQTGLYAINGLASGTHTLTIEATGTRNPASGGSWIWVDAFDVVGGTNQAVPQGPVGMTPGASDGLSQAFTFTFSDPAGWQNIAVVNVLIGNALNPRHACLVRFVPSGPFSGSVFLMDDNGEAGGSDSAMLLPGSGNVSNSQCRVDSAGSSAMWGNNTLTLTLAIHFDGGFSGNKVLFAASQDQLSNTTGWRVLGTWGVPVP